MEGDRSLRVLPVEVLDEMRGEERLETKVLGGFCGISQFCLLFTFMFR